MEMMRKWNETTTIPLHRPVAEKEQMSTSDDEGDCIFAQWLHGKIQNFNGSEKNCATTITSKITSIMFILLSDGNQFFFIGSYQDLEHRFDTNLKNIEKNLGRIFGQSDSSLKNMKQKILTGSLEQFISVQIDAKYKESTKKIKNFSRHIKSMRTKQENSRKEILSLHRNVEELRDVIEKSRKEYKTTKQRQEELSNKMRLINELSRISDQ